MVLRVEETLSIGTVFGEEDGSRSFGCLRQSFGDGRAAICQPQFALVCTSVVCFDSAQQ